MNEQENVMGEGRDVTVQAQESFSMLVKDGRGEDTPRLSSMESLGGAWRWIHLKRGDAAGSAWLKQAGLPALMTDALEAVETRPRWLVVGDGLLVVLRGVNLNPGAEPEDMVSLRLWVEPRRLITLEGRPVLAAGDMREALGDGHGPLQPGSALVWLTQHIIERVAPVMDELDDEADELEEMVLARPEAGLRQRVSQHRRQCIELRRHLAPMREVISALSLARLELLSDTDRSHLHEAADRLIRIVEDLDALRERAVVTHDELSTHISDHINRTMYLISLVAAVFLPLSLITSLLGINVAGIPGARHPMAFFTVCLILICLALLEWLILRRRFWLRNK